jgi:hypothetical protein
VREGVQDAVIETPRVPGGVGAGWTPHVHRARHCSLVGSSLPPGGDTQR